MIYDDLDSLTDELINEGLRNTLEKEEEQRMNEKEHHKITKKLYTDKLFEEIQREEEEMIDREKNVSEKLQEFSSEDIKTSKEYLHELIEIQQKPSSHEAINNITESLTEIKDLLKQVLIELRQIKINIR